MGWVKPTPRPVLRWLLLACCLLPSYLQAQTLSLHVLDVGEGQAVLLQKNQRAILIDTGHAGQARQVLERMKALGITTLDYVILTHLHPDHASGFFRIAEAFPRVQVLDSCQPIADNATPDIMRWVQQALEQHGNRQCVKADDRLQWQDSSITVLWPPAKPSIDANLNHNSLVLQIEYRDQTVLIMGDADKAAESELITAGRIMPADVLVVGHHGSDFASTEAFLEIVRPRYALISSNANNFRGYPSPRTVARLERFSDRSAG